MCSDPQNFINKETGEVKTGACRRCDDCIAARRQGWVCRAMAEKTGWPHTLIVALTYDDKADGGYDGARMFCYADVRAFVHRLTSASRRYARKHKLGVTPRVRFICAGEQGDREGRCHWHIVLYSTVDLTSLGEVKRLINGKRTVETDRAKMLTVGKHEIRLNWSLWRSGFVTFQEADEGGMHYVLSYCLKDQFTYEKSKGTMREAHVENFATGLFRMSKRPSIGEDFLMRKLEALDAKGAVLPNLQIKVPGLSGYWYPTSTMREKLLWGLVALNQRVVWATGANAPQWSSLLASCADNENDMEVLQYEPETEASAAFTEEIRGRQRPNRESEDYDREKRREAWRGTQWYENYGGVSASFVRLQSEGSTRRSYPRKIA